MSHLPPLHEILRPSDAVVYAAAEIAKRVTSWTTGWAYQVPGFMARRLCRRMSHMTVDKKKPAS